jgi:hypothetical protein
MFLLQSTFKYLYEKSLENQSIVLPLVATTCTGITAYFIFNMIQQPTTQNNKPKKHTVTVGDTGKQSVAPSEIKGIEPGAKVGKAATRHVDAEITISGNYSEQDKKMVKDFAKALMRR